MTLWDEVHTALVNGRPERAWDIAAAAWQDSHGSTRHHARDMLGAILRRLPDAAMTEARRRTVAQLGLAQPDAVAVPGVVAFPAVNRGLAGRFVEVRAEVLDGPGMDEWIGINRLARDTLGAGQEALEAVRTLEPGLRFRISVDGTGWSGESWGLAVALAALSAARSEAVSDRHVATGYVRADGQIDDVRHPLEKVQLLREARPRACMLAPPTWAGLGTPTLWPVTTLQEAWGRLGGVDDVDRELRRIRELDQNGQWERAAARALNVLEDPMLSEEDEAEMRVLLATASSHAADHRRQQRWLDELDHEPLRRLREVLFARAIGIRAVAAVDALEPHRGHEALALAEERDWGAEARLHLRGPRALLATLRGEHQTALELRERNVRTTTPAERARCLGDLADALLRLGDAQRAHEVLSDALTTFRAVRRRRGYQRITSLYLQLHLARALAGLGNRDDALQAIAEAYPITGIDPALRLHLLQAELTGDRDAVERRWQALPSWAIESPVIRALFERTRGRLGDDDARRQLVERPTFRGCDFDEAARRLPY